MDPKIERAKHVQSKYTDSLMQNQHVLGVSVRPIEGYVHKPEAYALVILVDEYVEPHHIPKVLEDVPVIIQKVGTTRTQ